MGRGSLVFGLTVCRSQHTFLILNMCSWIWTSYFLVYKAYTIQDIGIQIINMKRTYTGPTLSEWKKKMYIFLQQIETVVRWIEHPLMGSLGFIVCYNDICVKFISCLYLSLIIRWEWSHMLSSSTKNELIPFNWCAVYFSFSIYPYWLQIRSLAIKPLWKFV